METQARESAQFHPVGEIAAQVAGSAFHALDNFDGAGFPFHRRNIDIRVRQYPVHAHIGHVHPDQARVADLFDQHIRDFLADTVSNSL